MRWKARSDEERGLVSRTVRVLDRLYNQINDRRRKWDEPFIKVEVS